MSELKIDDITMHPIKNEEDVFILAIEGQMKGKDIPKQLRPFARDSFNGQCMFGDEDDDMFKSKEKFDNKPKRIFLKLDISSETVLKLLCLFQKIRKLEQNSVDLLERLFNKKGKDNG